MDIEFKDFLSDDDDDIMTIATQSLLFNEKMKELPTDTSSSRFGPTITVAKLAKQRFDLRESPKKNRSSGGEVVKLLTCGARGPGFDFLSRRYDSRVVIS